nr:hypothetical protein [uncultured Mediterraneibacter sp.]
MGKYYFDNGIGTSLELELRFLSYPEIERGYEETVLKTVPGRKGTVTIHTGTYSDTTILCHLHLTKEAEYLEQAYLRAKSWLKDTKTLVFSDNPSMFYRVKKVEVGKQNKVYGRFGTFDVTFTCDPGEYIVEGKKEYKISEIAFNPYSECSPIYKITGNGSCVLKVNGQQIKADVTKELTIDTELEIAYSDKGTKNTAVSGNYENIHLMSGDNAISITKGFDLKIIPNWRIL